MTQVPPKPTKPRRPVDWVVVGVWVVGVYVVVWLLSGGITAISCGLTGGHWIHNGNPFFENNWFGGTSYCVKAPGYYEDGYFPGAGY